MRFTTKTEVAVPPLKSLEEAQARRRKRLLAAGLLLVSAGIVVVSLLSEGSFMKIWQLREDRQELQQRLAVEEARREELQRRIVAARSDDFELERVAREDLGLVREGEVVFDFRAPALERRSQ